MLKNAVIELGYENKSGSILYSGNETLRKKGEKHISHLLNLKIQ